MRAPQTDLGRSLSCRVIDVRELGKQDDTRRPGLARHAGSAEITAPDPPHAARMTRDAVRCDIAGRPSGWSERMPRAHGKRQSEQRGLGQERPQNLGADPDEQSLAKVRMVLFGCEQQQEPPPQP